MSIRAKAMATLYRIGRITIIGLRKSVEDGVISADEYAEITGAEYTA